MDTQIAPPPVKSYFLTFGFINEFESRLKKIHGEKSKGCELYLSKYIFDKPEATYNFSVLNRYIDDIAPSKITFDSIEIQYTAGKRNKAGDDVVILMEKIIKIPVVEFKCCKMGTEFYAYLFGQPLFKTTEITFKACKVTFGRKSAIISNLENNYTIRSLNIDNSGISDGKCYIGDGFDSRLIEVDEKIKGYLYRNRAYHLCYMVALELILIRKYRHSVLDSLDISTIVHISKLIYTTKTSIEWRNSILAEIKRCI